MLKQTRFLSLGQILESKARFCCYHFEKYNTEAFGIFSKKKKKSEILFLDPSPCPPCWGADLYLLAVLVLPLVFIFVSTTKSKYKTQMYVCIPRSNLLASRTDPPGRACVCESGAQLCQYLITSTWSTNVSFKRR